MNTDIDYFWNNISELLENKNNYSYDELSTLIYDIVKKLISIDISVEISINNNQLEMILLWWHIKENILFINKLMKQKPNIKDCIIIWPKPALWFDFEINIEDSIIKASDLMFYPLKSNNIDKLWISFYFKNKDKISKEILWKIIETWIGDELSSNISYIDFTNEFKKEYLAISSLWDYLLWFINKEA